MLCAEISGDGGPADPQRRQSGWLRREAAGAAADRDRLSYGLSRCGPGSEGTSEGRDAGADGQ